MASLAPEVLRHALEVARRQGYAEVEVTNGTAEFKAKLEPLPRAPKSATPTEDASTEIALRPIKANQVGYYRPVAKPLEVGLVVAKGDVVAVISALGLVNDVESPVDGEVVEVLVSEGDPVQFGQVLAQVKP